MMGLTMRQPLAVIKAIATRCRRGEPGRVQDFRWSWRSVALGRIWTIHTRALRGDAPSRRVAAESTAGKYSRKVQQPQRP